MKVDKPSPLSYGRTIDLKATKINLKTTQILENIAAGLPQTIFATTFARIFWLKNLSDLRSIVLKRVRFAAPRKIYV